MIDFVFLVVTAFIAGHGITYRNEDGGQDFVRMLFGTNGRGSRLENTHMLNAGEDRIPMSANMSLKIMIPVHAPPTALGPADTA